MKQILILAALCISSSAFAQAQKAVAGPVKAKQETTVVTESTSVATGGAGGTVSGVVAGSTGNTSGNVTIGCLSNCADTTARDEAAIAASLAIAAGNQQAARDVAATTQTIKNTPSIGISQLTSSNDTCMGSVSAGGSGPGFSIGFGTTYTDENCKMLKNSRELWNMGMKGAAMALMCTNPANREALELTGFECPQTTKARQDAEAKAAADKKANQPTTPAAVTSSYTGNDPIVLARIAN